MSIFGKKKNQSVEETPVKAPSGGKAKASKKGGMSQVLHESVLETVMDDFKSNEPFITKADGDDVYVGLLLKVSDIGGLDKKSKKDEAKGSIIECINSGRIKTLITGDLMGKEELVIIPDAMTLSAMEEFSLLTDAPYELCLVTSDGTITPTGRETTYTEVSTLVADDGDVDELLGNDSEDEEEDDLDDYTLSDEEDDLEEDPDEDDIPDIDQPQALDPEPVSDVLEPDVQPEVQADVPPVSDAYEAAMQEEAPPEQEDDVPGEWVTEAVTRRFYSDDLGLEVTTEPFDAQFMNGNPFIPFDENRPEGWINNQLNEMSREANLEMSRLHQNNLFLMRERYFRLISMHCDRIAKDLDIYDPNTQYGQLHQALKQQREDAITHVDERVSDKKVELEKAWNQKLQEVGNDAARAAIHQYRERYGKQHELDVYHLESNVRSAVEADFNDELHAMQDRRRMEASKLLDLGITEVLDEISDMYVSALEDERVRYQELTENMKAFRDDNRQADIAMSKAMAEDLRQSEKADQVLAEQTAKISALTAEYTQKKKELSDEITRLQKDNQARIAELKSEADERLARSEREKDELQKKFDDLLTKFQTLDEDKNKEYAGRLEEMRDEVHSWEVKCNHMMDVHKRSNLISGFLVVAAVIAALAIGFIGGEYMNVSNNVREEQSRIISEFNQYQSEAAAEDAADAE